MGPASNAICDQGVFVVNTHDNNLPMEEPWATTGAEHLRDDSGSKSAESTTQETYRAENEKLDSWI